MDKYIRNTSVSLELNSVITIIFYAYQKVFQVLVLLLIISLFIKRKQKFLNSI